MKVGLHFSVQAYGKPWGEVLDEVMEDVILADQVGLSSALFAEHHFVEDAWVPQPLVLAAAAGAVTKNIRVGTDILIAPLVHPIALAEMAAVVDAVTHGRVILGLGSGWRLEDYEGYGTPFKGRGVVLEQIATIVRSLLAGEAVSRPGPLYAMNSIRLPIVPKSGLVVPIWLGATGPRGIRRAARYGDAWIMSPQVRVQKLLADVAIYEDELNEAGLPFPVDRPIRREAFIAETREEAWATFADGLRHEYGLVYRNRHPDFPTSGSVADLRRWSEGLMVVGSPDDVASEFERLADELKATEVLIRTHLPGVSVSKTRAGVELLGELAKRLGTYPAISA